MGIINKLSAIQQEMKAPKNMYNSFGKYKYRNAESILEAFKPFEKKYSVALILTDELIQVGERYYVKAVARLFDAESEDEVFVQALARESLDKKGMDDSQITGTASSYARKYALNGLFLLDDTKDADTDEYRAQSENNASDGIVNEQVDIHITEKEQEHIKAKCKKKGVSQNSVLQKYKLSSFAEMDVHTYNEALKLLDMYKDR